MTKRNIVTALGLLVTASACSGILGIENPTPVVCTNSDPSACTSGQTCENNQCVPTTSEASGGASSVQGTMSGGSTSLSSTSGGTSAVASSSVIGTGGSQTSGTTAATGGVIGFGGSQTGGTGALATGGVISSGGTSNSDTTHVGTVASGGAFDTGGSQNGGTSAVATGSTDNGGTSSTETTTTGGSIGSVGASGSTGGDTTVTTGGTSTRGAAADSGGQTTAGQTALGGQTAGGGAGGLSSGGSMGTTADAGTSCSVGEHRCYSYGAPSFAVAWQTCDNSGNWGQDVLCAGHCSVDKGCVVAQSCNGLSTNCLTNRNCCNAVPVLGGTFARSPVNDEVDQTCASPNVCPATLSNFLLDTFEVTVGRFRAFVQNYSQTMLNDGDGKNVNNPSDHGWDKSNWDGLLPASQTELVQALQSCTKATYTTDAGANEFLPINCVNWYTAYAFCAWDGARLPTEAEWNYAAAGGDQERVYPWSDPPQATTPLSTDYANYGNRNGAPQTVGKASLGVSRWGQLDLAGNVFEWLLDAYGGTYPDPKDCENCANLTWVDPPVQIRRGGAYNGDPTSIMVASRSTVAALSTSPSLGIRCARNP